MSWTKLERESGIYKHDHVEGKWRVRTTATDPDGQIKERQKTLTNATLEDAIRVREEIKETIRSPDEASASVPTRSIAYFADQWWHQMVDDERWAESTAQNNAQVLRDHIVPRIGHIDVDDLRRDDIRRWIEYMECARYDRCQSPDETDMVRYSDDSLRRYWAIMRHLIKALYLEGHVDRRFYEWSREIKGPETGVSGRRTPESLTAGELVDLLDAAEEVCPHRYPEIATLALTGMREGEMYALDWGHIDFDASIIHIEQSLDQYRGVKGTKTGPTRTAPIAPRLERALQAHSRRMMREQHPGFERGIVFPSDVGGRRRGTLRYPMRQAARACGIEVKVGPQVLRRSFISLLEQAGASRAIIQSITGHETEEMHDHYNRPRPEDQVDAVGFLEALGGG